MAARRERRWRVGARRSVLALLAVAALAAGGCASSRTYGVSRGELQRILHSKGIETPVVVPWEVGEEPRRWLAAAVPDKGNPQKRLQALLNRLIEPDGLGIRYAGGFSGTADEVFASRQANCLGFMNLLVGLARAMGYPVYFVAVEKGQSYGREGDLVVVADHIAAGYGPPKEMLLLDFVVGPPIKYEGLRPISDVTAAAKYYSNRGAEMIIAGGAGDALPWLETSVALDPGLATSWVNLGVARRRARDLAGAEVAYRQALEVDPRTHSAYQNLAALLRLRGKDEEALKLLAAVERLGSKNPYNFIVLGDWNLEAGRLDDARRLYRHALVLHRQDAEPYAALGELELASGRPSRARRLLRKALKLDPDNERAKELATRLAAGTSS
jgi:Flp pilus assembly protein TadD